MLDELIDALSAPQRLMWQVVPGLHDAETGQAYSGAQVANHLTGADPEGLWGKALGVAAEAALDPINLLGGLAVKGVRRAAAGAKEANLAREALLAKGAMPEEVALLTKVRNEAGPLRTYHGTPHVYDRFDPAKADPNGLFGPGYYTTQGPELASEYAVDMARPMESKAEEIRNLMQQQHDGIARSEARIAAGEPSPFEHYSWQDNIDGRRRALAKFEEELAQLTPRQNVRMQHLDIRNPLNVEALSHDEKRRIADWMGRARQSDVTSRLKGVGPDMPRMLSELGYDGLTHLPGTGSGAIGSVDEAERVWIALHPEQVYAPWVAPAAREAPSASPWAAALAGYNGGMAYARQRP